MNKYLSKQPNASLSRPLFGIVGGMGPLSSAQFLHSIYHHCHYQLASEQDYPRLILVSDPSLPDRAKSLDTDEEQNVIHMLEQAINKLSQFGADEIMIACITAHLYLKKIVVPSRVKMINMIDLLYQAIEKTPATSLALSSYAIRKYRMIDHFMVQYLEENDAKKIQEYIYRSKLKNDENIWYDLIDVCVQLSYKYHIDSLIFACTELHMLNKFIKSRSIALPFKIIDPLELATQYIINRSH